MEFKAGPSEGTTNIVWVATYVTIDYEDVPPVQVWDIVVTVWKTLASAAKANRERYGWIELEFLYLALMKVGCLSLTLWGNNYSNYM